MIFRRSLVNELANSAGGVFTVLFSIVLTVGLVRILGQAVGGRIDSTTVLELVVYTSLTNLPPLLALSLFIAVLIVLSRAWQDNEMVVWFSSGGVSLLAWIRPILRFSLPVILLIAVLSISIGPWAKGQIVRTTQQFEHRDDVNRISPGRFIETLGGRRVFFIEEVNQDGTQVRNIFMSEQGGDGSEIVIVADSGEIQTNSLGDRYIQLNRGHRYETAPGQSAAWRVAEFEKYALRMDVKQDSVYANADVDSMPIETLILTDSSVGKAQLLWRLCWPLAALNLVLLAIPLSYMNPRAGRSLSMVMAVMIFILYLNGISIMRTWVKAETLNWFEGLLAINGMVLALAVYLFIRRVWLQRWVPVWLSELPFRLLGGGR